ncbi:DUF3037 domain-containing protein [Glaciimonas immobilis]|uniref:DUF3037 domain-containing protein n=1 Tax=Glaciimonas immobilis TaxID=728004 RepID=A0A840RLW7_9BURK|nr:DUF3037 domain-containing protein [Glaciimonas immobilis]KAF3999190.1 DUF3037 domain-containing protein [Glaciimonas immobilis]MBB5198645.1 hypothetical protein [Glaciimonas immobilis]
MKTTDYYFSVLRVVPNVMRGERVNVGLVVFHPGGHDVTIHLHIIKDRLRALDPNLSAIKWDAWAMQAKESLTAIPVENRVHFLQTAFSPITTDTQTGWFKATSEEEVQDNIDGLLKRLVVSPQRVIRIENKGLPRTTKLQAELKNWFKAQKIMGKNMDDLSRSQIVSEYPVSLETDSYADFAFKNGALHVMETMDLRGVNYLSARLRNQAAFKSIVLDQAREVTQGGGQRIAVVSASDYSLVKPAIKMIERNADDVISMESQEDIDRLIRRLTEALHLTTQLSNPTLNLSHNKITDVAFNKMNPF